MATKSESSYYDADISPNMDDFDNEIGFNDILNLDGDQPLFQDNWNSLQDTPPYEPDGVYSTPNSWDPPQMRVMPKLEPVQVVQPNQLGMQSQQQLPAATPLSPAQQELLRSIAMPEHLQYSAQAHSPQSATSTYKSGSVSSPEHHDLPRKRKSSTEDIDDDHSADEGAPRPVKKTAHNMIEKRYRTNLNDKIAALRDSVPSLRVMAKGARGEDGEKEDLQGLTPAHKLNKATVLAKATEYIRHLEKRSRRLAEENATQKARIAAFEKLFIHGSMGITQTPPSTHQFTFGQDQWNGSSQMNNGQISPPNVSPRGMIEIPDNFRRIHEAQQINQQTYQVPQDSYQAMNRQQQGTNRWSNNGAYFGKMMVGSLAGLMILEGFSESQSTGDENDSRGLFAVPTHLLGAAARYIRSSAEVNILGTHFSAVQTFSYLRLFLMIGALLYVFIPSFFGTTEKPKDAKTAVPSTGVAPSLASPIQVRRQAWLTAIQTVWVPRHNFFLEAAALLLKMLKLSTRNLIGTSGYAILTGMTEAQEAARVKAWTIALDAQLVGGDIEISTSRLCLTLMASGTLPDTPARLMLKALHIRVLMLEIGNDSYVLNAIATWFARWKWNEARQFQARMQAVAAQGPNYEPLPEHLAALLQLEADDVLTDSIIQRAYNLAYNLDTSHKAPGESDGMDGIVDDHTIRSPLDAIAAWYSSMILHKVLEEALEADANTEVNLAIRIEDIQFAINTAPIGSGARLRGLVARAVFVPEDRGRSITAAMVELEALNPSDVAIIDNAAKTGAVPTLIMKPSTGSTLTNLSLAISCAKAIGQLGRPGSITGAFPIIRSINPTKLVQSSRLSLLGFASMYKLLDIIMEHEQAQEECQDSLEALAGALRIWIGGVEGERCGIAREVKANIVERCIDVAKGCVGMRDEHDTGYESMSDIGEGC